MPARVCSILVSLLLVLGVAMPLAAQDDDDLESEDSGDKGGDKEGDGDDYEEPDAWERPPMEEEKPKAEGKKSPAPTVEKAGDGLPFMAGLVVGWGFNTDRNNGGLGADPYGLGLGAMGGYTFPFQLYVGARFTYFLGSSEESTGGRPPVPTEASANYMHFAAEADYDLWAGDLIIRPGLLVGGVLGLFERQGAGDPFSDSTGDLLLGPGFVVLYPMDSLYLGGDLRGYVVMGDGVSGVGLNVTAGARFE